MNVIMMIYSKGRTLQGALLLLTKILRKEVIKSLFSGIHPLPALLSDLLLTRRPPFAQLSDMQLLDHHFHLHPASQTLRQSTADRTTAASLGPRDCTLNLPQIQLPEPPS